MSVDHRAVVEALRGTLAEQAADSEVAALDWLLAQVPPREPTLVMLAAALPILRPTSPECTEYDLATRVWRAMYDASLVEREQPATKYAVTATDGLGNVSTVYEIDLPASATPSEPPREPASVLIAGNPLSGFGVYGPYADVESAQAEASERFGTTTWVVALRPATAERLLVEREPVWPHDHVGVSVAVAAGIVSPTPSEPDAFDKAAARLDEFVARQRPLPAEIAEIAARRLPEIMDSATPSEPSAAETTDKFQQRLSPEQWNEVLRSVRDSCVDALRAGEDATITLGAAGLVAAAVDMTQADHAALREQITQAAEIEAQNGLLAREVEELRAQNEALFGELRRVAVRARVLRSDRMTPAGECLVCGRAWHESEPEQHFPGCLASLAQEERNDSTA